jgi:hypothetical protein
MVDHQADAHLPVEAVMTGEGALWIDLSFSTCGTPDMRLFSAAAAKAKRLPKANTRSTTTFAAWR